MATVVTYNDARTQEIIDGTVVDGSVDGSGNLILEKRSGPTFNAGSVGAPIGDQGPERPITPGRITLYGGATPPQGWAFCDGSTVSRVNFADLFSLIGTTYGGGDGETTFNLPNYKGKTLVGLDPTQTEFDVMGEFGGEKTHVLTTAELPAHTHTILGYSSQDDKNFTGNVNRLNASDAFVPYDKQTLGAGSGAAHNNLQPYTVIPYIISLGIAGFEGGGTAARRYFTTTGRGTTAQRDALYGVPSTTPQHVALANQRIVWFNTDLGWTESYYVTTGTAGLTVLGLMAGPPNGWYPVGEGPVMEVVATAAQTVAFNSFIGNFALDRRKGGASWFTLTGTDQINMLKDGNYDITVFTNQSVGTGVSDLILVVTDADGTTNYKTAYGGAFPRRTDMMTRAHLELYDVYVPAGKKVRFKLLQGTLPGATVFHDNGGSPSIRGRLVVRYMSPPLALE